MTVRNDIVCDFSTSPRILTISASSTTVDAWDLYETLRHFEETEEGILYSPLVQVAGKQDLGGGLMVGLTVTLLNAKIKFEARVGPDWVLCVISGGNVVALDGAGTAMDPREPSAYTTVDRAMSTSAAILSGSSITAGEVASAVWDELAGDHADAGTVGNYLNGIYNVRLTLSQQAVLDDDVPLIKKLLRNRLELAEGSSSNWILYDDDNITPLQSWNVTDKNGAGITINTGSPAKRIPV